MLFIRTSGKSPLDDSELILRYRNNGDKDSVGILFSRYSHLVFGVCMKYLKDQDECKDATLQIFEKLYDDLKKYEVQKFSFWLHSVARNYCLMQLRNRQAAMKREEDFAASEKSLVETEEESTPIAEKEIVFDKLEEAIKSLNEEQRICIELFYLKQKCYQEITELTDFNIKQVKSYIQNGKRNLKIFLQQHIHEHK